jgi:hypothetical protein
MSIWLQSVGTHEEPLDPDWIRNHDDLLGFVWTTKHPNQWSAGDTVVYYASGHGRIVAIVQLDGEAEGGSGGRWQWQTAVRPVAVLDVETAPLLADAGLAPVPEYKRLSIAEYQRICDLIGATLKSAGEVRE